MDFTIAIYKEMTIRTLTAVCVMMLMIYTHGHAQNHVITVNLTKQKNDLLIEPKLSFATSEQIKEAIDNGIRLQFIVKSQLYQPKTWWFDNVIENKKITLEVSYFTLGKLYIVKNKDTSEQLSFNDYEKIWERFEQLMSFNYNKQQVQDKWFKLRVMLDKGALPTAMQLPVLFDANWDVNTPWYQHKLD